MSHIKRKQIGATDLNLKSSGLSVSVVVGLEGTCQDIRLGMSGVVPYSTSNHRAVIFETGLLGLGCWSLEAIFFTGPSCLGFSAFGICLAQPQNPDSDCLNP